jgi:predicted RNA-binding Zn-ribbon protein involved in translation (DUF1610 family)
VAAGRRRRWPGRIARWIGTVLCALIVLVYVPSGWYRLRVALRVGSMEEAFFGIGLGSMMIGRISHWGFVPTDRLRVELSRDAAPSWPLWFEWDFVAAGGRGVPWNGWVAVPLWAPLVAFGFPTVLLWRREFRRRRNPDLCSCGYDLTGLRFRGAAITCPECGKVRAVRAGIAE